MIAQEKCLKVRVLTVSIIYRIKFYILNLEYAETKRTPFVKPIPIQKTISCLLSCYLGRSESCACAPHMRD